MPNNSAAQLLLLLLLPALCTRARAQGSVTLTPGAAELSVTAVGESFFRVQVQVDRGVEDEDQWVAFGVGQDAAASCGMGSSSLVVGRLCSSETCGDATAVQMYETNGYSGVTSNTNSDGTLRNASISREGTVLTLNFEADIIGAESLIDSRCVIWAAGALTTDSANDHLERHFSANGETMRRSSISVNFAALAASPIDSPAPTPQPSDAPSNPVGTIEAFNGDLDVTYQVTASGATRIVARYPMTSGWIGIGLSDDGSMVGSHAVIGGLGVSDLPASVGEYQLKSYGTPSLYTGSSEMSDASVTVDGGVMEVSFTATSIAGRTLDASGDDHIVFAVYQGSTFGRQHDNAGNARVNWTSPVPSSVSQMSAFQTLLFAIIAMRAAVRA
ncbi:Hypothetical Protein FCC1311_035002 [Hondaea fermentalgiana]|uniref:DOMON domain-containing protein n=1 Tax=Hondaea fermentalgiana TaxID=2315210 RepID=A0A2R5GC39_9STRA|nr:Hypothetical Protein FCC1311_035002 [Hondaea fermentalgiana]|eukprot:GBG27278.1 Hypothetical Protein FCC1311_035002 [Hondaea fermentalgiana]